VPRCSSFTQKLALVRKQVSRLWYQRWLLQPPAQRNVRNPEESQVSFEGRMLVTCLLRRQSTQAKHTCAAKFPIQQTDG